MLPGVPEIITSQAEQQPAVARFQNIALDGSNTRHTKEKDKERKHFAIVSVVDTDAIR